MILTEYQDINGIKVFHKTKTAHSDYNAKSLDNLYHAENKHFWFISRKEFIYRNMLAYIPKSNHIIEIGAGTGNVSRFLMQNNYKHLSVGEMHNNGLQYAKDYGIKDCYQFDLLNSPFADEFDTICLFDVLEHIEDDDLALENIHKSLKEKGQVVLTVPAHMWLWNRADTIAGHKRRYTKKELILKLKSNDFEIISIKYFFISITPLFYLRTKLNKDYGSKIRDEEYHSNITINPIINNILLFISRFENKINRFLPNLFGGSLFVIARKR